MVTLAALIFAAFLLSNATYVFNTELYEDSDFAANSLQVRNAKQFRELHGNSSRWAFHHPGPAFFYVYGAGEAVFHDLLHAVPTPFNGQKIALYALTAFLLAASITIAASPLSRNGRRFFVPLALLAAVAHFAAVGRVFQLIPGDNGLLSSWPPCVLLAPFLCLIVTAASLGSGRGQHLPLLVFSGCLLVHGHVGQPLFVVPIAMLAYAGLTAHAQQTSTDHRARWPWRAFPRQHVVALAILVLFALPLIIDIAVVRPSNFSLIVEHLHAHRGERKPLRQSLLYFLHFAAYSPFPNAAEPGAFGAYDKAAMVSFFEAHWRVYTIWAAVFIAAPVLLLLDRRQRHLSAVARCGDGAEFVRWLCLTTISAIGLTLVWGRLQDGPMFYFNAFFNFAIYYAFGLLCLAAIVQWCDSWFARRDGTPAGWHANRAAPGLLALAVAFAFAFNADAFRASAGGLRGNKPLATAVRSAIAADPQPSTEKLLSFEHDAWPLAYGLALQLDRRRQPWRFPEAWRTRFGVEQTLSAAPSDESLLPAWRVISTAAAAAVQRKEDWLLLPLPYGGVLATAPPLLDPDDGRIVFGDGANFPAYQRYGWSSAEGAFAWSEGRTAQLDFRPLRAEMDVDLAVEITPFIVPPTLSAQRVELSFNGVAIADWRLNAPERVSLKAHVPATLWNSAAEARVQFTFPDARSSLSLGMNSDMRLLGARFHKLEFHRADGSDQPAAKTN